MAFFLRRLLILIVFAIFPVLVVQVAYRQIEHLEVEKLSEELTKKQLRVLGVLKQNDSEPIMISRSFQRVFATIKNLPFTRQKKIVKNLYRIFPRAFDAYFFDANGRLIKDLSSQRHARRAVEMSYQALRDIAAGRKLAPEIEGLMKSVYNLTNVGSLAGSKQKAFFMGNREFNSWTIHDFQKTENGEGIQGYFALIHHSALPKDYSLGLSIRAFNRHSPMHQAGWANTRGGLVEVYPDAFESKPGFRAAFMRALNQYDMQFDDGENVVSMVMRSSGGYCFISSPRPRFFPDGLKHAFHVVCVFWIFLVLYKIVDGGSGLVLRIPVRLLALFFFAVGTPSLVLLVGGFYALKDHSHVRQQQMEKLVEEKVQRFDQRYPLFLGDLAYRLRQVVLAARSQTDQQKRISIYQKFEDEKAMDFVVVVDHRGREVFKTKRFSSLMSQNQTFQQRGQFALLISRELLKKLNGSMKIDAGSLVMEATSGVLNTLVGDASFSFDGLLATMGEMFDMSLAGESSFIFVDAVQITGSENVEEMVSGFCSGIQQEAIYLEKHLSQLNKQPDLKWRVHAWGDYVGGRMVEKRNYRQAVVMQSDDAKMVDEIGQNYLRTKNHTRQVVRRNGSDELWMTFRGKHLTKYTLIAAVSLQDLQQTVRTLWFALVVTAVFVLLSTLIIGMFLSEQFLKPIEDLNQGIRSIEERRFEYRVPIHQHDELGDMAGLMNTVIEGMKDLQVARIVQENLFPQSALSLGSYQIYGKSRAMADIGGDYFDYFAVGGTQIVGLVGDVSGHGVSAALIMGMAKCNFAMDEHQSRSLLENLTSFNSFLLKTVQKKKMMTMFHFGVNIERHRMTFINAGHNFPMYYDAVKKSVRMLEQPALPLGMMKKVTYKPLELDLQPGDAVLFYTDGLVEAKDRNGEVIGYETAQQWLAECAAAGAEGIVDSLFARFDQVTTGQEAEDDVSIICLKRSC
ncbi:MAG TPA: SpoIIE family protein phosphatase [Candidatus Ozemobacteraceae bacterium]|nr:SpoIIE family protein phosphatase [Candidatus Ozemobacteraceae bacterium]